MPIFPRLPSEFDSLFQLLDDHDVYRSKCHMNHDPVQFFTPKFDVRESNGSYHLDGELPGASQDDIEIQFTDPHTLVVKGRSQRSLSNSLDIYRREGSPNDISTKSLQPTVEDEDADNTTTTVTTSRSSESVEAESQSDSWEKYLVSERSTGEFSRTFTFSTRVDQDAVKARLRNGILSIVIPKESAPRAKKIRIE